MTFRFKPRVYVHPDRYGAVKTLGPNRLLVIHTSEGGETGVAAENLCSFMGMVGDRFNADGSTYGASYQYVTDTDEGLYPATPDNVVAYAAAGANHDGIHFCIPGKAGQDELGWADADSQAHIASLAWGMKQKSIEHTIPLIHLTDSQIINGHAGYCDHWAISRVYKRSTHTDVGQHFPWNQLAALFVPIPPPQGGDMAALAGGAIRIYDSRGAQNGGNKVSAGRTVRVGVLTPPFGMGAAVVDIGVDQPEGSGFLSTTGGTTSVQDYKTGDTKSNTWLAPVDRRDGAWGFDLYVHATAHVVVELQGWAPVV